MKPIEFKGFNVVYGKDQPEYNPLPAFRDENDLQGTVVTCWRMSWRERIKVLFLGRVYMSQLTFKKPLQPQYVTTRKADLIYIPGTTIAERYSNLCRACDRLKEAFWETRIGSFFRRYGAGILAGLLIGFSAFVLLSCERSGSVSGYVVHKHHEPESVVSVYDPSIHISTLKTYPEKWVVWVADKNGSRPCQVTKEAFDSLRNGQFVELKIK